MSGIFRSCLRIFQLFLGQFVFWKIRRQYKYSFHHPNEVNMAAILLLNASYEPISVIPDRRALSLLLRGRVDAATEDVVTLHGMSLTLQIPIVLRLRRYINVPQRGARWSRTSVLRRDGYHCIYCGLGVGEAQRGKLLHKQDFTIDHLMPRSKGGRNTWGNTACACYNCNQRKGNRTPHDAGMKLLWEPKIPRVDYLVVGGNIPDAWKFYLEI